MDLLIGFAIIAGLLYFVGSVMKGTLQPGSSGASDLQDILPRQFVVFDLETTGLDARQNEIIEIAAIKANRDSRSHLSFQALVKPEAKLPEVITRITGITQKMVDRDGEDLGSVLDGFIAFAGDLRLVAFNAEFDVRFLEAALSRHGRKMDNPVSCALKMSRRAFRGRRSYKLTSLAEDHGISTTGSHRALKDCEMALAIYVEAARKLGSAT